jgi:hypothetical protein
MESIAKVQLAMAAKELAAKLGEFHQMLQPRLDSIKERLST